VARAVSGIAVAVPLVAVLLWGELEHWRAARRGMGTRPGDRGTGEVVVVLGFRNRGRRANFVNRWRVRAGLRSRQPGSGPSRLVLSGGPAAGPVSEAELMAAYARGPRGYAGPLATETRSLTTWQNVQNVIPLIADADRIKIVSDPLHAERARAFLWEQRPDLAQRLVPAADYRFGELALIKPVIAARRLRNRRKPAPAAVP
jgi:hypothetical protein